MDTSTINRIANDIVVKYGIRVSKSHEYRSLPGMFQKQIREKVYEKLPNSPII